MFHFRQFSLSDENAAMKTGTDAVLLGAWASVPSAGKILDIGTGSGILALMMAQRSQAEIDAVEIDAGSASQAISNIGISPWRDRIKVFHSAVQDYAGSCLSTYELIISNPPFFSNSLKAPDPQRSRAKHNDSLPVGQLMLASSELLSPAGCLSLIFPWDAKETWLGSARSQGLYANRLTVVIPREGKTPVRVMAEFRKTSPALAESQLIIRSADGSYTQEYKELTSEFYLGL